MIISADIGECSSHWLNDRLVHAGLVVPDPLVNGVAEGEVLGVLVENVGV